MEYQKLLVKIMCFVVAVGYLWLMSKQEGKMGQV